MTTNGFRVQPNDRAAEQVVLGAMLTSSTLAAQGLSLLAGSDFYHPPHGIVFETVAALLEESAAVEIGMVHSRMLANGTLAKIGGGTYLFELLQAAPASGKNLAWYAGQVAELAQRRALIDAGARIMDRAWSAEGNTSADEMTDWATGEIAAVKVGTGDAHPDDALSDEDLLAAPPAMNWVVPGLLERGDRMMLTSWEGAGKTTLIRQFAVAASHGLDPFTQRRIPGVKVLVVDAENGRSLTMRRYRPLLQAARALGDNAGFALHLQPGGLDLAQRAGTGWLLRRVEKFKPDLLAIGPLYRLHIGDPSDERDARRVAAVLDRAREISGCALLLEAHSPHQGVGKRPLRPVGSSLWLRWPEFGIGLRPSTEDGAAAFRVMDVEHWRGARDERSWPKRIRAGTDGWPWTDDQPVRSGW